MNATAILLNIIFSLAFLGHFIYLVHDDLTQTELYTQMRIVSLADQHFPLRTSICVTPGYNKTEVENAGYKTFGFYQFGQSKHNASLIGWAGHTVDGKKLFDDSSVLQGRLALWKNLSEIIAKFLFVENGEYNIKNKSVVDSMVEFIRPYHDKCCFILYPNIISSRFSALYLSFHKSIQFSELMIRFEDNNLFASRKIRKNAFNYKGSEVKYEKTNTRDENIVKSYSVEMMQQIYVKEDKTKNCFDYPKEYTYDDCNRQYDLAKLAQEVKPGFTPPWTTDNWSSVNSEPVSLENREFGILTNMWNGLERTDCRLPCTITKTRTISSGEQESNESGIVVSFNEDMQVTKTTIVRFNFFRFLSEIGGILGLWLGLGMVQLGELLLRRWMV